MEEKIKQKIINAAQRWVEENLTDEAIEIYVDSILNKQKDKIIAQLLGFRIDSWTKEFEINNTNGHEGDFAVGKFIEERSKIAIDKWLEENIGMLPKLNKKEFASLRKEYNRTYKEGLKSKIQHLAEEDADLDTEDIIKSLLEQPANYLTSE
jgi:hypothetical protein